MPLRIKLNDECVHLIKHIASRDNYSRGTNARRVHAETAISHDISYQSVARFLAEYRQRDGQVYSSISPATAHDLVARIQQAWQLLPQQVLQRAIDALP
jgi:hypothetical protein